MSELIENIQSILLIILIIFQFGVMGYLLYTNHVKFKEDKKFWKKQEEISEEFLKQIREDSSLLYSEAKEDVADEREDADKE